MFCICVCTYTSMLCWLACLRACPLLKKQQLLLNWTGRRSDDEFGQRNKQTNKQTSKQTNKQTNKLHFKNKQHSCPPMPTQAGQDKQNKKANKQANKQTNKQTNNKQTKQTIKQTSKQTNKQTNKQINTTTDETNKQAWKIAMARQTML